MNKDQESKGCHNCYYDGVGGLRCEGCKRLDPKLQQWRPKSKLEYKKNTVKIYLAVGIKPRATGEVPCYGCMYRFEDCKPYRAHMVEKGFNDCRDGIDFIYYMQRLNKRKPKDFDKGV